MFLSPIIVCLVLSGASTASHCATWTTSSPEHSVCNEAIGLCHYVDFDYICDPQCWIYSAWIYQESNGQSGLQRLDDVEDDTCYGMIPGDTIVY